MIYGYDNNDNLYFYDMALNDKTAADDSIDSTQFKQAFFAATESIRENVSAILCLQGTPLSVLRLKAIDRKPNLYRIYFELKKYLKNDFYDLDILRLHNSTPNYSGIDIYKGIGELINEMLYKDTNILKNNSLITWGLIDFYRIKYSYIDRLHYLKLNGYIDYDEALITKIKKYCEELNLAIGLLHKYEFNFKANSLLYAKEILVFLKEEDEQIIECICSSIEFAIRNDTEKYSDI